MQKERRLSWKVRLYILYIIFCELTHNVIRGKAKRKIQAKYPFLGGGTYQPPVLSVLYLQVGYQPEARWQK